MVFNYFIFISLILFALIPRFEKNFDLLQEESQNRTAELVTHDLYHHIKDKELALHDIARNIPTLNMGTSRKQRYSKLQNELRSIHLLGQPVDLTLLSDEGQIIASEKGYHRSLKWALLALNQKRSRLNLVPSKKDPRMELAIPFQFQLNKKGVLIASTSAKPEDIFDPDFFSKKSVVISYSQGHKRNFISKTQSSPSCNQKSSNA